MLQYIFLLFYFHFHHQFSLWSHVQTCRWSILYSERSLWGWPHNQESIQKLKPLLLWGEIACISLRISFTNLPMSLLLTIMYLTTVPVQDRTRPMLLLMERERSLSVKMENPSTRDILADSPLDCKRTVAGNSNNLTVVLGKLFNVFNFLKLRTSENMIKIAQYILINLDIYRFLLLNIW